VSPSTPFDVVDGQNTEVREPAALAGRLLPTIVLKHVLTKLSEVGFVVSTLVALLGANEVVAVVTEDAEARRVTPLLKIAKLVRPLAYLTTMFCPIPIHMVESKELELSLAAQGTLGGASAVVGEHLSMKAFPQCFDVHAIYRSFARQTHLLCTRLTVPMSVGHRYKVIPTTLRALSCHNLDL
jgi:hypothetical protein